MQRSYAIHPGIGIARVGDSPDDYFVGPEVARRCTRAGESRNRPEHRTALTRTLEDTIKRQGARFRIFETTVDDSGQRREVREITAAEATDRVDRASGERQGGRTAVHVQRSRGRHPAQCGDS